MSTLSLKNIQYGYGSNGAPLFDRLNFDLPSGGIALLVGDNGSGKTTLGKLLTGLLRPLKGQVLVDGKDVHAMKVHDRPKHVIYMGQISYLQFFRATIQEEIEFAKRTSGIVPDDAETAYSKFSLPRDLREKPMDLAYPEMWRLQLYLMTIIYDPAVLFIDEIVAPNAHFQKSALETVIERRAKKGQVTIVAYQRPFGLPVSRTLYLQDRAIVDGRSRERASAPPE